MEHGKFVPFSSGLRAQGSGLRAQGAGHGAWGMEHRAWKESWLKFTDKIV